MARNTPCYFTLPKGLWWLFTLIGLSALFFLMMKAKQLPIETDLNNRATQALQAKNMPWAKTDLFNRGRDLLLTGVAPSNEARQQAIAIAQSVQGVRTVDHNITLSEVQAPILESASLSLMQSGEKVIVSGMMPSQDTIDKIVNETQQVYGINNVENQLQLSDSVSPPSWLASVGKLIPSLPKLSNATLNADNANFSVTGEAQDAETQQALSGIINSISNEIGISANTQIGKAPEPVAETPTNEAIQAAPEATAEIATTPVEDTSSETAKNNCQQQLDEALNKSTILFATNSATISSVSYPLLNTLGNVINECQAIIATKGIEIAGHTDSRGKDSYNLKLSQQRADAVMAYLQQYNVSSRLMRARGYGETQPIAAEDTPEGLAKNRRITFVIQ
ncbi:MAG: Outer membrane lipoprotein omp16 precursor [uncultured Thiotrichaceae bacterium]|uniref:Outer membrane lipoprotein omp16 n=1 Tax=uncultured Thiotrichaceae bacterium TaxID=298394 RepID=A0A6S6S8A9_9GAMM|nr:MAG: Outer membrane lipoprotein omp16 precursor [uncultured Thiotrichaceae bacterium]